MIYVSIVYVIGYVLSVIFHILSDRYLCARIDSWYGDELSLILTFQLFWPIMLPYMVVGSLRALPKARRESIEAPVQSLTFISTHEDLIKYIVELDKAKSVYDIDHVYANGRMPPRYTKGGYISAGSITADRIMAVSITADRITFGGIK